METQLVRQHRHRRTFETSLDGCGGEVIIVVHEADVSRGEADCQEWFLAMHCRVRERMQ